MISTNAKMAWHIHHYQELFRAEGANGTELEFVRYSKRHLTGWTAEAEEYCKRIAALRQTLRFEEYVMARHIFEELLDLSQLHHQANKYLRGYILDECRRPAGTARIGQMLGCDTKTADKYLKILERVGLIERGVVPEPPSAAPLPATSGPLSENDFPPELRGKKPAGVSKTRKNGQSGTQVEPPPPAFFKEEEEVKRKSEAEEQEKAKTRNRTASEKDKGKGKTKSDTTAPATPPPSCKSEGQAQEPMQRQKGKSESESEGQARCQEPAEVRRTGQQEGTEQLDPMSDHPTSPSETDSGDALKPPAAHFALPVPSEAEQRLLRMSAIQRKVNSPELFADMIYSSLREPHAKGSLAWAQEHGMFFAFWQDVMRHRSRLDLEAMESLWSKCVHTAVRLGAKRERIISAGKRKSGTPGRPGAVWGYEVNKRLNSLLNSQVTAAAGTN